jgi:predicted RNA binding protein YcfA (HicA-like mRNA interferase family)
MPLSGKEMVKLFLRHSWLIDRIKGSHYIMVKNNITVTIPVHGNKSLPIGLERAILKQGEIKK